MNEFGHEMAIYPSFRASAIVISLKSLEDWAIFGETFIS